MDELREALAQYDDGEAGTHQVSELAAAARRFLALTETGQRVEWCETHGAQAVDKWTCHKRARPSFQPLECHIVSKLLIPADYLTEEDR